ncbi:hypothetical protein N7488_005924 [Penicillium malachiteum]|nr:hypothetical protein N7488_005924 [Penicillium malachiteum]
MEPDEDKHELKICDEHPCYCNFVSDHLHNGETRSIPFAKHQIPIEAEARARDFLRDTMPHLAERPLTFARICWDADTPDRAFLIDRHPRYRSLLVALGGSGNGAMQMQSLRPELKNVFRWRPDTAVDRDWHATQNRFGGPYKVMDFQSVHDDEWTRIESGST